MIRSVAHVCVKTRDLTRTTEFYCDILGLTKCFDFVKEGQVIGFYLKTASETFIEVFHDPSASAQQGQRALDHFCFETDSLARLHEKLRERGYRPGEIIMGADRARQFWVNDPNGLAIELQEYGSDSSQRTGQPVHLT